MTKKKCIFILIIVFNLFIILHGKKISVIENIMRPSTINIYNSKLFITDDYSINIYNLKTFELETKFGKKGKGPGEFEMYPRVLLKNKLMILSDRSKLIWFSLKGKLIKEIKKSPWGTLIPMQDNFLKQKINFDPKTRKVDIEVILLDDKMKKIKKLYNGVVDSFNIMLTSDNGKETKKMIPHYLGILTDEKHIYIADSKKGLFIQIFDYNGNKINIINPRVKNLSVSSEYKKKVIDKLKKSKDWKMIKKNNFLFYDNFPKIKSFLVKNNKIFVATHKVIDNKNEFIIFDKSGKILNKVFLPMENVIYTFDNNKYYYLKENESTESWELFSILL